MREGGRVDGWHNLVGGRAMVNILTECIPPGRRINKYFLKKGRNKPQQKGENGDILNFGPKRQFSTFTIFLIFPLKRRKNKEEIRIFAFLVCLGKDKNFWAEYLPLE